jgi:hypothetical protein
MAMILIRMLTASRPFEMLLLALITDQPKWKEPIYSHELQQLPQANACISTGANDRSSATFIWFAIWTDIGDDTFDILSVWAGTHRWDVDTI